MVAFLFGHDVAARSGVDVFSGEEVLSVVVAPVGGGDAT